MSVPPVTRRRTETRNRLLDAAVGVFADKGIHASTVEEICDRAGFTRGAFYSNYDTKNELVLALVHRASHDNLAGFTHLASQAVRASLTGSREQILSGALQLFLAARDTRRQWVLGQAEIRLYAVREPEVSKDYREFRQASLATFVDAVRAVQEVFGLTFAFPLEPAIEVIDPVFQSCMLDAFMLPEAREITDLTELDPALLAVAMRPLMNFLTTWVSDIQTAAG